MRHFAEKIFQSKAAVGCTALAAFIFFCIGVTLAFGQAGDSRPEAARTQPDTRPASLTVVPGGKGVGSTQASAMLQSQSAQSSQLTAPTTGLALMGQTGVSLQAGVGGLNAATARDLPLP